MIVKFRQWRHKLVALGDRDYRARLALKGVKLMNDLTRRQQAIVRQARESNQVAYFVKGKLTVQPRRPDLRSYAQVAATTSRAGSSAVQEATTSRTGGSAAQEPMTIRTGGSAAQDAMTSRTGGSAALETTTGRTGGSAAQETTTSRTGGSPAREATTPATPGRAADDRQRGGCGPSALRSTSQTGASSTSQGGSPVSRHVTEGAPKKRTTGPVQPAVAETGASRSVLSTPVTPVPEGTTTRADVTEDNTGGEDGEGGLSTCVTQLEEQRRACKVNSVWDVGSGGGGRKKGRGGKGDGDKEGKEKEGLRVCKNGLKTGKSQANMHEFLRDRPNNKNTTPEDTRRSSRHRSQTNVK